MPNLSNSDCQFQNIQYRTSELEHRYGNNVHLLANPFLLTLLSRLCSKETTQPLINYYITEIYSELLRIVINREFPLRQEKVPTRMQEFHPEGVYEGAILDPKTKVVSVNLARAGTLPSHVCYSALNYLLLPEQVRQDHISVGRTTNSSDQVTGSEVSGHKIGGSSDQSIILFPDPMGATGGTILKVVELYRSLGKPKKFIALHCIVTPEYIKNLQSKAPDVLIYAARLDRGLSSPEVLQTIPGTHWDSEKGLNEKQYIVPGGGGFGEILNNAYV